MNPSAANLLSKLRAIQGDTSRGSWPERRDLLRRYLENELRSLSPSQAATLLTEMNRELTSAGESAGTEALGRIRELEAQCDRLATQLDEARTRVTELEAARRQRQAAGRNGFIECVRAVFRGESPDLTDMGLSSRDRTLVGTLAEIVSSSDSFHRNINTLMGELSGEAEAVGTEVGNAKRGELLRLLKGVESGDTASAERIKKLLSDNNKLVLYLHLAFVEACKPAFAGLLDQLDPTVILEQHRRVIGHDFEAAYRAIASKIGDASGMTSRDAWDGFLAPPVRERLNRLLESLS